jgi:hypothetical protein
VWAQDRYSRTLLSPKGEVLGTPGSTIMGPLRLLSHSDVRCCVTDASATTETPPLESLTSPGSTRTRRYSQIDNHIVARHLVLKVSVAKLPKLPIPTKYPWVWLGYTFSYMFQSKNMSEMPLASTRTLSCCSCGAGHRPATSGS